MTPATHATEGSVSAPVLYMALELSNQTWRLAFSAGAKRRQVSVPGSDLAKLGLRGGEGLGVSAFQGEMRGAQ
jgi:hypothetical protein